MHKTKSTLIFRLIFSRRNRLATINLDSERRTFVRRRHGDTGEADISIFVGISCSARERDFKSARSALAGATQRRSLETELEGERQFDAAFK